MKKLFALALYGISIVATPWFVVLALAVIVIALFRAPVSALVGVLLFDILFAPPSATLFGILSLPVVCVLVFIVATTVVRTRLLE